MTVMPIHTYGFEGVTVIHYRGLESQQKHGLEKKGI
jgi:hypothetical protein